MTTILIIDDDPHNRDSVGRNLTAHGYQIFEAGDVETAWNLIVTQQPDIAIIDIIIPTKPGEMAIYEESEGMLLAQRVKQHNPKLGVILFSAHPDRGNYIFEMFQKGIRGIAYILKSTPPRELLRKIKDVQNGGFFVGPGITDKDLLESRLLAQFDEQETEAIHYAVENFKDLSDREMEVVKLYAASQNSKGVAQALNLAPSYIEKITTLIYQKLGLSELTKEKGNTLRPTIILAKAYMIYELRNK